MTEEEEVAAGWGPKPVSSEVIGLRRRDAVSIPKLHGPARKGKLRRHLVVAFPISSFVRSVLQLWWSITSYSRRLNIITPRVGCI